MKVTFDILRNFLIEVTLNSGTEKSAVAENTYLDINPPFTT